ncbi:MAG: hypothetical protein DMF60_21750 [Acidobacteria bacterium]|nr:MAG: hypothetical protein DMF60_21750 [Acidobacteriota bacterium]
MFIPRGKAVHENLATSYVRVDALVADLSEGGFSGVVEVELRDTDSFVVISSGSIAGVLEKRGTHEQHVERDSLNASYTRTTLAELAERSCLQRGRVSIYGYSAETAGAVARRINAKSLYVGLSTVFTDLEKMILKLVREPDREWFVDINTNGAPSALIHIRDGACRILNSDEVAPDEDSGSLDFANNKALGKLLSESKHAGTTFDVHFSRAGEEAGEDEADRIEVEAPTISGFRSVDMLANGAHFDAQADSNQRQASGSLAPIDTKASHVDWDLAPLDLIGDEPYRQEHTEGLYNVRAATANHPGFESVPDGAPASGIVSSPDSAWNLIEAEPAESAAGTEGLSSPSGAEAITEVRRLMGEIARTIEEAAQAVDRPESFSMSLRAGQLKIADRYPFLDPFAGEIEYLTGEIVFVGQATVEDFIAGLTEALKLAVLAVTKSTAYPERFRAYVTEDLRKLLARERQQFEGLGLDQSIEQIIRL